MQQLTHEMIGILCGGISSEREVSLRSGANIFKALQKGGYNVVLLDLQKREELFDLICTHNVKIVFNTLHGYYGEDGRLQAALEELGVVYTGCSMESSSVSMNKVFTKLIAKSLGIPVADHIVISGQEELYINKLKERLPFVIKPQNGGSSVETYLVKNEADLKQLEIKNKHLDFIVEQFIDGKEITAGVLSHATETKALPILELRSSNSFYDYDAKYTEGKTQFIIPAQISDRLTQQVQAYAVLMHQTLKCSGATRSDFMIENDIPYFLELNSSPGMTELSDVPAEAANIGISLLKLCEFILKSAMDRV